MTRVLVIEDDPGIRHNLEDLLHEEGFEVLSAGDGQQGIALALSQKPDIILCDILMPKTDGYGVLGAVRADPATFTTPFVFLTAKADKNDVRAGMNLGADDYITKPFRGADVVDTLRARLERAAKLSKGAASVRPGRGPVMRDEATRRVFEQVDLVARDVIAVLILGETGVGKEVVARAVHERSARAKAPFLALNCAALSESLLEAELFGHEKGAFTGAVGDKKGLFEAADGGTVFLDELGELPAATQVKLLRVMQEHEVMRIGARSPIKVDVRFVAATNRDLEERIATGAFREDLYYRVAGFVLHVPPLRERPEDVMALAESFVAAACAVSGRTAPGFSAEAVATLRAHAWPGNVRELRNAIERALVVCGDGAIAPNHFALRVPRRPSDAPPASLPQSEPTPSSTLPDSLGGGPRNLREEQMALERRRIIEALEKFAGNQTKAAEFLGMSRRTLVTRLSEYDLPRPRKKE